MNRIVILEGPDGAGKTTLANELVVKYGFRYKHEGPPPISADLHAHYLKVLNESIESPFDTVHDRLWLGERIYGPVARGLDRLGPEGQKLILRLHTSKQIKMLICLPKLKAVKENYVRKLETGHDYLQSPEKLVKVFQSYCHWLYNYGNMGELYDYTKDFSISKLLDSFDPHSVLPSGTVGSRLAKYLFIGDRPNHLTIDVPFHAVDGSSGYFNRALELANIAEPDVAISNAFGPGKLTSPIKHSLRSMIDKLPHLTNIFLMGKNAQEWFSNSVMSPQDLHLRDVHNLPHPSYLKRFYGANPKVLAKMIKDITYAKNN